MSILAWIILGLIVGFIANKLVNKTGEGVLMNIVLGIVGAVFGGELINKFWHSRSDVAEHVERARVCRRRGAFPGRLSRPARRALKTDCLIINTHQRLDQHLFFPTLSNMGRQYIPAWPKMPTLPSLR